MSSSRLRLTLAAALLAGCAATRSNPGQIYPAPNNMPGDLAAFIKPGTTDDALRPLLEMINHWPPLPKPTPPGYPQPLQRLGIPEQGEFSHVLVIGFDKRANAAERAEVEHDLVSSPLVDHVQQGGCAGLSLQSCLGWGQQWQAYADRHPTGTSP